MGDLAVDGWQWVLVLLLGGACGGLASVVTVWLLIRPGTAVRLGPLPVLPSGLLAGAFGSDRFRRDLGAALLASPAVQDGAQRYLRERAAEVRGRRLGALLPEERRSELIGRAVAALQSKAADPAWEDAVRKGVRDIVLRAAASEQHLRRYVPLNTAALSISTVEAAVPLVLAQLEQALQNRANLERLYLALREASERFVAQQQGWKGGVARMIITDRTIGEATRWIVTIGFGKLAALLREPGTQARLALALDDAAARVLDKPIRELAAGLAAERIEGVSEDAASRIMAMLRDPSLAPRLARSLHVLVDQLGDRTLGELVGIRTPERAQQIADTASARLFEVLCKDAAIRRRPGVVIWEAVRADLGWIVVRAGSLAALLAAVLFAVFNLG